MGYNTNLSGRFTLDKPLEPQHLAMLRGLCDLDRTDTPEGAPDSYCQWEPTEDGTAIRYNGEEKFYYYAEWITWICTTLLGPWGYRANGVVKWAGDDVEDHGEIRCVDNAVTAVKFDLADDDLLIATINALPRERRDRIIDRIG